MGKIAIVTGEAGMDGHHMFDLLETKGYELWAVWKKNINDIHEIIRESQADEIYNFAGVSDVINPFDDVQNIMDVNLGIPIKILSTITKHSPHTKFFQASSCLALKPTYPYGVSKQAADNLIKQYRERFGIYACSGIFYPHESPRRKDHFFSKMIVNAAKNKQPIAIGSVDNYRDYGYAPDYMEAAWLMLQQDKPKDYEIGTGKLTLLRDFVSEVFKQAGLDPKDYITIDNSLSRNEEIMRANIVPIYEELGWRPKHSVKDLIKIMLNETVKQTV